MKKPGVYQILNLVNGNKYVGSSLQMSGRWAGHKRDSKNKKHCSIYFQRAWDIYGPDKFDFLVLEVVEPDGYDLKDIDQRSNFIAKLRAREQYWIDSLKPEYNLAPLAHSMATYKWSEESKAKMIGNTNSKGTTNPEWAAKISASLTGRKNPHEGQPRSEECRKKSSETKKANYASGKTSKVKSAEWIAKIAAAQVGKKRKPWTPEFRTYMLACREAKKKDSNKT